MAHSYPIWNDITACIYKSNKSYGVKRDGINKIKIGTSASNSHDFATIKTTHKIMDNGDRQFRLYVDNRLIKSAILRKGEDRIRLSEWVDLIPEDEDQKASDDYNDLIKENK